MITLYAFGPAFGLPDPSPFVTKAEILLKLSGVDYRIDTGGFDRAPKGKLPYIRDGEQIVADSTFIRLHLEHRYGIDFDKGLSSAERGVAWAVEKMCEDHLYWLIVHDRWMEDGNFARGPAAFFERAPAPIRPLVKATIRRRVRRNLHGQGAGRFTPDERKILARHAFSAVAAILDDNPYLMGGSPCGADATVFAFLSGSLCPLFDTPLRTGVEAFPTLVDYCGRMSRRFYPE
jgi:glutathione S-transferase